MQDNINSLKFYGKALTIAPAAADTIGNFLRDTGTSPRDYDLILTGDLGLVGTECLYELLGSDGVDLSGVHNDAGLMIFDRVAQDVHAGGSGCGCCASVLCASVLPDMLAGRLKNVLLIATGALMSPTSSMQGESIPAVAHLVNIVRA